MPLHPSPHTDELAALAGQLAAIPMPPAHLPGWQSLCASEYARSVTGIGMALDAARATVERARAAEG